MYDFHFNAGKLFFEQDSMKKVNRYLLLIVGFVFLYGCQPDSTDEATPTNKEINFVGSWNRDSVIVYEIEGSVKTRTDEAVNDGFYTFNTDKQTGVLTLSSGDFLITWNYNMNANTIKISEIDWQSQLYEIKEISSVKLMLTGYRDAGSGIQEQRVMYITKK